MRTLLSLSVAVLAGLLMTRVDQGEEGTVHA